MAARIVGQAGILRSGFTTQNMVTDVVNPTLLTRLPSAT